MYLLPRIVQLYSLTETQPNIEEIKIEDLQPLLELIKTKVTEINKMMAEFYRAALRKRAQQKSIKKVADRVLDKWKETDPTIDPYDPLNGIKSKVIQE